MKPLLSKTFSRLFSKDPKELDVSSEEYDYFSFDIFDTLVSRTVEKPTDIFEVMSQSIENKQIRQSFPKDRIDAERMARKRKKTEITLDEIYAELSDLRGYSKDATASLMALEIATEKDKVFSRPEMMQMFLRLAEFKPVFLTSDMYLDRETIFEILQVAGYQVEGLRLYLSSELGHTKRDGSLFEFVKRDLGIEEKTVLHIGDNPLSDFLRPKQKGFCAKLIKA